MMVFLSISYMAPYVSIEFEITINNCFWFITSISIIFSLSAKFKEFEYASISEIFWFPENLRYNPTNSNTKQTIINIAKKITVDKRIFFDMNDFYNLKVKINKEENSNRLDKVLSNIIKNISRSQIKILIENSNVKLDNTIIKSPAFNVKEGQIFDVKLIKDTAQKFEPENIKLEIIYEDNDLLVVNKQAGIVTHPAPGNQNGTLVNAILNHTKNLSKVNELSRPGIVHRLDKDTSGLIVIAKNDETHMDLSNQFKSHSISRRYHAIVWGVPNNQIIEGYIERHKINRKKMVINKSNNGKYSKTKIKLIQNFEIASLVECSLYTGRTHQVRVHMTSVNSPIVGDKVYGKTKINQYSKNKDFFNRFMILKNFGRQALHAFHLGFMHPKYKKTMEFNIKPPNDMRHLLNFLVKY